MAAVRGPNPTQALEPRGSMVAAGIFPGPDGCPDVAIRTCKEGQQKMVDPTTKVAGIDVGKAHLWLAIWPDGDPRQFANNASGREMIGAELAAAGVVRVGLEASGGYERDLRDSLQAAGFQVVRHQPAQVRSFARSKLKRAKSDRIDARMIAWFTAEAREARILPPDPERERLAERLTYYEQIADDLRRLRTRCDGFRDPAIKAELEQRIAELLALKRACLAGMRKAAKACKPMLGTIELLQSIPGIGFLNALVLAVRMPELAELNRQQAAALLGVAPFHDESGKHDGPRHIAGGRQNARNTFYMAALAATRSHPKFKAFYQGLVARGKHHKVALVACMRKLIAAANAVLKRKSPWIDEPAAA